LSSALIAVRWLLAVVFAASAVAKLADLQGSRRAVGEFGMLERLSASVSVLLPAGELAVAAALLPAGSARWGAVGALAMSLGIYMSAGSAGRRGKLARVYALGTGRVLVMAVAVAASVVSFAVPAAAQAAVQSLTGEVLEQGGAGAPGGIGTTTYNCNPGATSNFTWSSSGTALGPYPGTYAESGTVTMDGPDPASGRGPVTSFQAQFTITSATGTVTGTKTLAASPSLARGVCLSNPPVGTLAAGMILDATYQAHISTPTGTADDQGTAAGTQLILCNTPAPTTDVCGNPGNGESFFEAFLSTQITQGPPPAPTSKDQCKKGGWKNYPALGFKNQGDCVSYVATHGKNAPAGSPSH
jgi:hypothetical protein